MRYGRPGFYREVAKLFKDITEINTETDKTELYVYEDKGKSFKFKYHNKKGNLTNEVRTLESFPMSSSEVIISTNADLDFGITDRVTIAGENSLINRIERMPDTTRLRGIKKKREVKILWLT